MSEPPPPQTHDAQFSRAAKEAQDVGSVASWLRGLDWALLVACSVLAAILAAQGRWTLAPAAFVVGGGRAWTIFRPRLHARRALAEAARSHYARPLGFWAPVGWAAQTLRDSPPQLTGVRVVSPDAWVEVVYWAEGVLPPDPLQRWLDGFEPDEHTHDLAPRELAVAGVTLRGGEVTVMRRLSGWTALSVTGATPRGVLEVRSVRSLHTPFALIERVLEGVELDEGAASTEPPAA